MKSRHPGGQGFAMQRRSENLIFIEGNEDPQKAPVRLMTAFLKSVQNMEPNGIAEAMRLADEILEIEPQNRLVGDYQAALQEFQKFAGEVVVDYIYLYL